MHCGSLRPLVLAAFEGALLSTYAYHMVRLRETVRGAASLVLRVVRVGERAALAAPRRAELCDAGGVVGPAVGRVPA